MSRLILLITCFLISAIQSFSQSCNQPGALLSVKTAHKSDQEFIVFTFIDPHNPKGELHKVANGPFIQTPLNNPIKVAGIHFYKITFPNPYATCDTKNYITPHKKVLDVKALERSNGILSYIIGIAENAKIIAHTSYNYHGVHIVKLRVQ